MKEQQISNRNYGFAQFCKKFCCKKGILLDAGQLLGHVNAHRLDIVERNTLRQQRLQEASQPGTNSWLGWPLSEHSSR